MYRWQTSRSLVILALAVSLLAGCATQRAVDQGREAFEKENWDAAVFHYLEALARDPGNTEYQMKLTFARQRAANVHFQRGLRLRELGRLLAAQREVEMAVQLDPTNQFAEQVLQQLRKELEILSGPGGAQELEELKRKAREAKVKPPVLDPKSKEPITLNFPKPKPVKEIYTAMAKAYGFNVIFDPKLRDDKLSIELNDVTAERALELVMQNAGHFYKALDANTIIIAEDTPQNRRDYEDLVIKTFFLSNADVKEVDKLLRSLIEARRLSTNEQLNAITLRDTADKVAIAERLIQVNDKAKAEVLVDVELLLMASTEDSTLGAALSSYSFNFNLNTGAINPDAPDGSLSLDDFSNISRGDVFVNVPSIIINLAKSSGEAEVLAQPQLRITEGEQASLHIGDRVPIPVTSFNTSNTIGGSVVPVTSFQYQDVGIRIEVEPRVHHNQEVTLKLTVEVSNLGETVPVGPDQEAVTIGTRNITSVIRLKSGESSLLAGLIRKDTTIGETKTPLLSDIPWLGRLFTNRSVNTKNTDLVLTMTPHIIRFPDIREEDLAPVWVGTESRISFSGSGSPRVESGQTRQGPFDASEVQRRPVPAPRAGTGRSLGLPRRVTPEEQPPQGEELVPGVDNGSGEEKSLEEDAPSGPGWGESGGDDRYPGEGAEGEARDGDLAASGPPLFVGFEPSVVSLAPGEEAIVQLVVRNAPATYRLPLEVSYDPKRVTVEAIESAPGVEMLDGSIDDASGWLGFEVFRGSGTDDNHAVAALRVRATSPGPVPLIISSDGAAAEDGSPLRLSAADGALFVSRSLLVPEQ